MYITQPHQLYHNMGVSARKPFCLFVFHSSSGHGPGRRYVERVQSISTRRHLHIMHRRTKLHQPGCNAADPRQPGMVEVFRRLPRDTRPVVGGAQHAQRHPALPLTPRQIHGMHGGCIKPIACCTPTTATGTGRWPAHQLASAKADRCWRWAIVQGLRCQHSCSSTAGRRNHVWGACAVNTCWLTTPAHQHTGCRARHRPCADT